jgi:hypothetical protein
LIKKNGGTKAEARPINFHAMDPNVVLQKQEPTSQPGIDEIHENMRIDKTKEYQDKFVDKVDPFGKNVKKKVIKTSTIKFVAEEPGQLGKAKKADIGEAAVKRGTAGYDEG